jgi:hypothetical protein
MFLILSSAFTSISSLQHKERRMYLAPLLPNINPGVTNISLDITSNQNVQSAKALFARIGVKANGADQAVYSEIFRLK